MVRILGLVLQDLTSFVFSQFSFQGKGEEAAAVKPMALRAPSAPVLLPKEPEAILDGEVLVDSDATEVVDELPPQTFRTIRDLLPTLESAQEPQAPAVVRRSMVIGRSHEPLYARPVREYDGVLAKLSYGAMVSVGNIEQQWVDALHGERSGYVHRDALYESVAQTRPYFVVKEFAGPLSTNTLRLRSIIDDEFAAGTLELPLQSEEYVYYRLLAVGVVPPQTPVRPRLAGSWQRIYRGLGGVRIGVRPKTNAVMEYLDTNGVGHLAYVAAVFPDESITICEIGSPEPGYYNERTLDTAAWQELQPVFIQFS